MVSNWNYRDRTGSESIILFLDLEQINSKHFTYLEVWIKYLVQEIKELNVGQVTRWLLLSNSVRSYRIKILTGKQAMFINNFFMSRCLCGRHTQSPIHSEMSYGYNHLFRPMIKNSFRRRHPLYDKDDDQTEENGFKIPV